MPMSRLGEQYGIPGNGLKKICDRLNVPYPPRGFWAKLSAGKSVTQISLPKPLADTPQQVTITPTQLADAGPILEKRRLEAEEAQRRRWKEEERRRREKEEQDQDRNRWRRFVQYAKLWRQAQLAGELISALEACLPHADALYGGKSADEWLTWARERRDAFNPTNWDIASLWTEIASITAWDSRSAIDYMEE